MNSQENNDKTKGVLFGVAIGDALGVPVEFDVRAKRKTDPVTDFRGGGTLGLPLGTFSDDSSITFCLAEALSKDRNGMQRTILSIGNRRDIGLWTTMCSTSATPPVRPLGILKTLALRTKAQTVTVPSCG